MSEERNRNLERIMTLANWDWDNPEEVYDKWIRKDHEAIGPFLMSLYEGCDEKKIKSLYFNYEYLENQILYFVPADSQAYDKVRWVLKQYFNHLTEDDVEDLPELSEEEGYYGNRKWYHPEFGTTENWIDFVEAIDDMYRHGPTEKNLRVIQNMHKRYNRYLNR